MKLVLPAGAGGHFQPGGVGPHHDGPLLFHQPLGGLQVDAGRVVGSELPVVAAGFSPVTQGAGAHEDGVSGLDGGALLLQGGPEVLGSDGRPLP